MTEPEDELLAAWAEVSRLTSAAYGHVQLLNPELDPPTIAYATAELRNAADRIHAAITQLKGLRP